MAITGVSSSKDLAAQLSTQIDTNKDGQISTTEFGAFIFNLLEGKLSNSSASSSTKNALASAASATANESGDAAGLGFSLDESSPNSIWKATRLGEMPSFLGFDLARAGAPSTALSAAGSLKYDAYNVLKNYDPRDPNAMKQAYAQLSALHPGAYELDDQDNLMLTGTADGYIGARPIDRNNDWNNRAQPWAWQWMAYNEAHPGPNGEIT